MSGTAARWEALAGGGLLVVGMWARLAQVCECVKVKVAAGRRINGR